MTPRKWRNSPLLYPAIVLSLASLAWTTWSLVDLLGAGIWGLTVAAGSDIIWGSVIVAEARGLRIVVRTRNIVSAFGWLALAVVIAFLAWHGLAQHSYPMAVGGPFLPVGAKVVWVLALTDMRDPAALTHDELHVLARMERGMAFEEARHRIGMRQQKMAAELVMNEVSVDFDIEEMRQQRTRDLRRRAPLALPPAEPPRTAYPGFEEVAESAVKVARLEPEPEAQFVEPAARKAEPSVSEQAIVLTSSQVAVPEPPVHPVEPGGHAFGFSAHLTAQSAQRAQSVARVAELVAQDPGITSAQVAEQLAVSPATAKRYLREARQGGRP